MRTIFARADHQQVHSAAELVTPIAATISLEEPSAPPPVQTSDTSH